MERWVVRRGMVVWTPPQRAQAAESGWGKQAHQPRSSSPTSGSRRRGREQSGLGLEAQRKSIEDFARSRNAALLGCFTEVESGKNPDRPELAKALHLAKVTGSTLIIAKLDRLSRNAAFLLTLRD